MSWFSSIGAAIKPTPNTSSWLTWTKMFKVLRWKKKPKMNPDPNTNTMLNIMMSFTDCMKVRFWWVQGDLSYRVGLALPGHSLLTSNSPKTYLHTTSVFDTKVIKAYRMLAYRMLGLILKQTVPMLRNNYVFQLQYCSILWRSQLIRT